MAFTDLDEALGELGYSGTWTEQTESFAVQAKAASVVKWAKEKWGEHFPEVRARRAASRRASHLRLYKPHPRQKREVTCGHPERRHKGQGKCLKCYNQSYVRPSCRGHVAHRLQWNLPFQKHRHCAGWELVEQQRATNLARQRAETWA